MSKILLVEDNEMNRDMLSRRLERKGMTVVMAFDGQAGIEMASSESPDLILMDLSLPVIDGWEATKRIKASAETRSIPVIALTAHAMSGDEVEHWFLPEHVSGGSKRQRQAITGEGNQSCWMKS